MSKRAFEDLSHPVSLWILAQVERPCRRTASSGFAVAAPDAVAHVRVGRVKDAGPGQVAQIALVLLDLLVAARQVQRHFGHVVNIAVADVPHLQPGSFHPLLQADEVLRCCSLAPARDAHVLDAELLRELQVFVSGLAGNLQRHLNPRRQRFQLFRRLRLLRLPDRARCARRGGQFDEISAWHGTIERERGGGHGASLTSDRAALKRFSESSRSARVEGCWS